MPKGYGYGPDAGKNSPTEMSPYKMGHSPNEMSSDLKYNPIDDIEKGKGEANYSGSWMSKFAGNSRMGGHSPMKMAKPDYPDIDGDGDKKESMKKAAKDKKNKK